MVDKAIAREKSAVDNTLKLITFGIAINQAQRRQARYAQFNVTISSRNLQVDNTEFLDLTPAEWLNPVNFLAYISLPKVGNLLHP
jgi:outer membrane protein TolC